MQIAKYIGEWGRFQTFIYILMLVPCAFGGVVIMVFSFTGSMAQNRCTLPGLDQHMDYSSPPVESNFAMLYADPKIQGGKSSYCQYCPHVVQALWNNGTSNPSAELLSLQASNYTCSSNHSVSCNHGHIYDRSQYKSTIAIEFDMVCGDIWKRDMAKSMMTIGNLVGVLIFGNLADRIGRKLTFVIATIIDVISFNITPLMPNLPLICIFNIINSACAIGAYLCGFVIVMEYVGDKYRTAAGVMLQCFFTIGYLWVGIMAYVIRDWQWLHWACSIPAILLLPYFFILPESVRWLLTKNKIEEAKQIVARAARWNGKDFNPNLALDLDADTKREEATVIDLFKHKLMIKNTLIVFYTWFAVSNGYYGLSLNSDDLPGSDFVNYLILGLVEFPAYILTVLLMNYWGRKPSLSSLMITGGASCIISAFIPHGSLSWLVVTFAMIGKLCITAAFAVVYNYSAELFPTVVRNAGMGTASFCARIGSTAAPYIHILHDTVTWGPFVIYGAICMSAGILDLFLTESKGKPLPETIEDGILFCKGLPFGEMDDPTSGKVNQSFAVEEDYAPQVTKI